jgi:hypothetical protein
MNIKTSRATYKLALSEGLLIRPWIPAIVTALFAIVVAFYCVLRAAAQDVPTTGPQLHSRPEAPKEQLLPRSSVAPFVVPNPKKYPQKYAAVYMPVSLAEGRVRTPEFPVAKTQWYAIVIQLEQILPPLRMRCMTGATLGPLDERDCGENERVLSADWTLWEGGHIVCWGSIPDEDGGKWGKEIIIQVGSVGLVAGKKYVVQVHFTKDGSTLNVADPHLIVIPHGEMYG